MRVKDDLALVLSWPCVWNTELCPSQAACQPAACHHDSNCLTPDLLQPDSSHCCLAFIPIPHYSLLSGYLIMALICHYSLCHSRAPAWIMLGCCKRREHEKEKGDNYWRSTLPMPNTSIVGGYYIWN